VDVSRSVTEGYKIWIALGGVGLALSWRFLPRRIAMQWLIALCVVAGLNYARWGTRLLFERVDTYDLIHYYLNAKYFDELGYYDLYPACILADHENLGPWFEEGPRFMDQDDAGHQFQPISVAVDKGRVVRDAKFTPERWAEFEHDFIYLQRQVTGLDAKLWRQLIQDHGFNGTTFWTLTAAPIANLVPVEAVKWLGMLDLVLLAGALGLVAWAWDGAAALWGLLFLLVTYSTRWPTISWVFLRYDYVAALVAGMALLKRGKLAAAGVLTAWAGLLRLFPLAWAYGPLAQLWRDRRMLRFFLAFGASLLVLQGAATLYCGPEAVRTHIENMDDHVRAEQLSSRRIGFANALVFEGRLLPTNMTDTMRHRIGEQARPRTVIALVLLGLLGWVLRRARPEEAFALGFLPFYLLTTASYYYYVARLPLIVMHAGSLDRPRDRYGLAFLLGVEVFCNWAESTWPEHRVFLIGWLAWAMAAYTVAMIAALWKGWGEAR
jgi:hypothetical protein